MNSVASIMIQLDLAKLFFSSENENTSRTMQYAVFGLLITVTV